MSDNSGGRRQDVAFAVAAFNEGAGVRVALARLHAAATKIGLGASPIILSDSSETPATAEAAEEWARTSGALLIVDRAEQRRSLKAAINAAFARASAEILVLTVGDVWIEGRGLSALLEALECDPDINIAVGTSMPDPGVRGLRHRAGAWQIRAMRRAVTMRPATAPRADGALWAARRAFYSSYRFPVGSGLIADDAELAQVIATGAVRALTVPAAIAYRIPAGSVADFSAGLVRSRVANPDHRRWPQEYLGALVEAALDPAGAVLYALYRVLGARRGGAGEVPLTETWSPQSTTKPTITE